MGSEKGHTNLKQFFDGIKLILIEQEKDNMIFVLYHNIMMRHYDFFATDNRTNGGTYRQLDLLNSPANHLRIRFITMSDRFYRFRCTTS